MGVGCWVMLPTMVVVVLTIVPIIVFSRFETFLPDGLDTIAEVIEDLATLDATTGRQEAADNAGDVTADVESLRVIHTDAFHAEAEASDAGKHHGVAFAEFLF